MNILSQVLPVAAAGTNQATATPIPIFSQLGIDVTPVPAGSGVILPISQTGSNILIYNTGANTLNIYPPSFGAIDGGSQNVPITLAAGSKVVLYSVSSTSWSINWVSFSGGGGGGSGIVNAGSTNQLGYYSAPGTALNPLSLGTNLSIASGSLNAATGSSSTITETSETANFNAAPGGFYAISGSSAVTATLPSASGIAGQTVRVRCVPGYTGLCTITGTGGQTVGGQTSRIIYANESPLLQSDGANWVRTGGALVPCRAKIFLSTTQSVPGSAVLTKILFDAVAFDNAGLMATVTSNQIAAFRAGTYGLTFKVNAIPTAPISQIYALIYKNGSAMEQNAFFYDTSAPTVVTWGVGVVIALAAGDIITCVINLSTGTTIYGSSSYPSGANPATTLEVVEVPSW